MKLQRIKKAVSGGLRLSWFVFLILGVPILIFLPTIGIDIPSPPIFLDQIVESIVCGVLGALALVFIWLMMVYGIPGIIKADKQSNRWLSFAYYIWALVLAMSAAYWAFSNLYNLCNPSQQSPQDGMTSNDGEGWPVKWARMDWCRKSKAD